jgi:hypothetical protein
MRLVGGSAWRRWSLLGCAAVCFGLCACGSTSPGPPSPAVVTPTPTPSTSPTSTPSAAPSAPATSGTLAAAPGALAFNSTGQTQTVSLTDRGSNGTFTVSGCTGIVSDAVVSGTLSVTSIAGGTCSLTISDNLAQAVAVSVSVTQYVVPIQ